MIIDLKRSIDLRWLLMSGAIFISNDLVVIIVINIIVVIIITKPKPAYRIPAYPLQEVMIFGVPLRAPTEPTKRQTDTQTYFW